MLVTNEFITAQLIGWSRGKTGLKIFQYRS